MSGTSGACEVYAEVPAAVRRSGGFEDMSGRSFGSVTVLGLLRGGPWWVCNCRCGARVLRRSRAIRYPNPSDCCGECREDQRLSALVAPELPR